MRIRELAEKRFEGIYLYKDMLQHVLTLRKPSETCSLYMAVLASDSKSPSTADLSGILHWKLRKTRRVIRRLKRAGVFVFARPGVLELVNRPGFSLTSHNTDTSTNTEDKTEYKTEEKKNKERKYITKKEKEEIYIQSGKYLPVHLNTKAFRKRWKTWITCRKEITGKYLKPTTIKFQLRKLGKFTEQEARAMIKQSIEHGWTGLFPVKVDKHTFVSGNNSSLTIPGSLNDIVLRFVKRVTGGNLESLDTAERIILKEIIQDIQWYYKQLPGERNAGSYDRGKNKYFISSWTSFARKYFEFLLDHSKSSPIHFYKVRSNSWNWFIRTLGERYSISFEIKGKGMDEN